MNTQLEIKHLDHVAKRFPNEARFMLAQGIARDRVWHDDAFKAYTAVANDPDVGGEAAMRLGTMQMYRNQLELALAEFDRAEQLTRDPYVVYLARFFRAQVFEAKGSGERVGAGAIAARRRPFRTRSRRRSPWRRWPCATDAGPKPRRWRSRC